MEYWKQPHISKIYEALTAMADGRFKMMGDNQARCYSSSGNKFYEINFSLEKYAIMSNDNTAWYTNSVSYPMIGFLMLKGKIPYNRAIAEQLKGQKWKDINQKFNNDYDKSITYVLHNLKEQGIDIKKIQTEVEKISTKLSQMNIGILDPKRFPPKGY